MSATLAPEIDPKMAAILNASMDIYLTHEEGAGCGQCGPEERCLPYRTADSVLTMWAHVAYLAVDTPAN